MDTATEKLVRDTVTQFVSDGYMFTAWDITNTLKKAGANLHHSESKKVIQNMFANGDMGSYVRDAVDVNAPKGMPFVYYHPYADVSKYDQDWVNTNPTQNGMKVDTATAPTSTPSGSGAYTPPSLDGDGNGGGTATATATQTATQTGAQVSSPFAQASTIPTKVQLGKNEHLVTKEGRLQIPIDLVKAEGYTPLQMVYLVVDVTATKLVLSGLSNHGNAKVFPVLVEKDGRIRVCQTILEKISTGNKFKIEKDMGNQTLQQITISVA